MDFRQALKERILIFDGAMGSMLQTKGLKLGELPEELNISRPEWIVEIHRDYIEAGADILTTNTFGANERKLDNSGYSVEEVIGAAVENARKAIGSGSNFIALDIGPIGELLEPMGSLSFEEAYRIFQRQVKVGLEAGVDLVIIETMTDLYEAKAAILAVKENSNLPVITTMTFEKEGRSFTGSSPASMVMTLEGLGVDALGLNCSLGPKEIEPILEEIVKYTRHTPIIVQANAGLPLIHGEKTIYNVSPKEYAAYGKRFLDKGVRLIGGCCGTTDEYIRELSRLDLTLRKIGKAPAYSGVASASRALLIDGPKIIGERINPTGKEDFKRALINNDMDFFLKEAIVQMDAGADILDINVGLAEINEEESMVRLIKEIQAIVDLPLQIDSSNPKAIEAGLRVYNGKAIVNSVNGEDKALDEILPIVKKYGAGLVGLTLDENGIPKSAYERFRIAKKILRRAEDHGISKDDIYIDTLTLTVAAQQEEVIETLKAIRLVKEELGLKTVLGVSNVSFGLPRRELINKVFLGAALYEGLDLAIINPLDREMIDTIKASNLLWNKDMGARDFMDYSESEKDRAKVKLQDRSKDELGLYDIILKGMKDSAQPVTEELLLKKEGLEIVNQDIMPALDVVGERYEKGLLFLPQLIQAAETVKASFEIIKTNLAKNNKEDLSRGKIILATVKGDIHDIGKNIVKILLENYNFDIIDLGKDVSPQLILDRAREEGVRLVGLSSLMTTTLKSMEETIELLKDNIDDISIMVGGAVLDQDYSSEIGADFYAQDAKDAVKIAMEVLV